jgi:rRNA-processing protein CGR1
MVCSREPLPSTELRKAAPNSEAGKQWHEPKSAFRPKAGNSSYAKRLEERKAMGAVKAKEKEMKEEKEAERQVSYPSADEVFCFISILHKDKAWLTVGQRRIKAIKDKRAVKEEKARYEKMAETMHKKRVERLKRREKRNKMLKS